MFQYNVIWEKGLYCWRVVIGKGKDIQKKLNLENIVISQGSKGIRNCLKN